MGATARARTLAPTLKSPDPACRIGAARFRAGLVGAAEARRQRLPVGQVIDIAEQRRARRQFCGHGEVRIEDVVSSGRRVDGVITTLEGSSVIGGVVETDEGAFVVEGYTAPVFQEAQEVMHAAIGAKAVVIGDL